jgi:hypothetical protein
VGIAAADPDLLPVGSVIQVDQLGERYNGVYTVMDTGPKVHGRHVDIYMWNCYEALELGRRSMQISVLRLGWNPQASDPAVVDRLFRERETNLPPPPVWPPVHRVVDEDDGGAAPAAATAAATVPPK